MPVGLTFAMYLKCLVIFLNVILSGYAATETSRPECNRKEVRCLDGQCKPIEVGCAGAPLLKALFTDFKRPETSNETKLKPTVAAYYENRNITECRLRLHPQYSYECLNGKCNDFITQGTVVNVTRHVSNSNATPVSIQVTCGLNGTYNVNFGCMGEIEQLQNELKDLSTSKMIVATESNKDRQTVVQARKLVDNYSGFMSQVQAKLDQIQRKIEECDMYSDFLLNQFDDEFPASPEETNRTCGLPPLPKNGRYNVTKSQVQTQVSTEKTDLFVLHYACERGFALIGTESPRCINGAWLDQFPNCLAGCTLKKKSGFNYHCPKADSDNDVCENYLTVGSVVKVSRQAKENVTVTISCLNGGAFNISTDCVQEIDDLQREFENPTLDKMITFETKFNDMKDNTVSYEFETLVNEFHSFQQRVIHNLNLMHQKAEECDISLDLLLP